MAKKQDEKPYKIKKVAESGQFKLYNPDGEALLEGYEDKEFKSPIEAAHFIKGVLKTMDEAATEAERKVADTNKVVALADKSIPPVTEEKAFQIPIIEGKDPFIEVIGNTRYFEVVIREHGETGRPSTPISDGCVSNYYVALGKPVILPESVINTANEAVYTTVTTVQNEATHATHNVYADIERFSVDIKREVTAEEAVKWLKEQRKVNINIFG
jgi:hypothetical protein